MGADATHLLATFATVENHDPSEYHCLGPISHDICSTIGILEIICVFRVPEPGMRRQVRPLELVLWFALESAGAPGLKLRASMTAAVYNPEHNSNIVDRDCEEFDEPKFPGYRSGGSVLIGLNSLPVKAG